MGKHTVRNWGIVAGAVVIGGAYLITRGGFIPPPRITVVPTSGPRGTMFTITVQNITWTGQYIGVQSGSFEVDQGAFGGTQVFSTPITTNAYGGFSITVSTTNLWPTGSMVFGCHFPTFQGIGLDTILGSFTVT